MEGHEHAALTCDSCGQETEHRLTYAGHVLVSTTCTECGYVRHHSDRVLRETYAHDLRNRVAHKPPEIYRRFRRRPVETAVSLPLAIIRLPVKLAREVVTVLRN